MKKDNNAIKRLLKYTNVKDLHGYFKQDNNYILCNSISVIKFDSNNIDFIDNIEQSQSIHYSYDKFNNMFKDVLKAIQDNNNTIKIDIQDLKMWKKHADKNKPFVFKTGDNYAGVNATYLLDLASLTRQDKNNAVTIQAYNNKTPLYIAGNDVSAVLCPIGLKEGYNGNDYNSFIDSLADCYTKEKAIQEEKHAKKAAKSTKTIEKETLYNGFTMWIGSKQYFLMSDKKRVTDEITKDFLKLIAANTTINVDKISESDFKYIKNGINSATITKTTSYYGNEEIYRIETKYNSENFYKNELDRLIIYNGNMEKIDILADDMSATDEETPKTATIQNNAADIVKADTVKDDTRTATDTAATKDINTDLKTIETPVILRYSDYEHIRIKKGYYINVRNYDYIIYQLQVTNEYRIYNLNYMMPYGCDDFKTVADAVNHLNDTADKQNEYYNIHNHYTKQEIYNIYASYNFYNKYELVKQYVEKDMQADARQDATPTQDKPHKTSKKAISLFVVTDKPQPVKLPHLKPLNNIPMFQERFKTDFKQRNNARVYKYRGSNKKALKKAYNDFNNPVSCYNDKCAIGGGSVAVDSS